MATKIEFTYKNNDYVLEYNRDAIRRMEKDGYNISKLEDMVVTSMEIVFKYAFFKNHKDVFNNDDLLDEIQAMLDDKESLYETLFTMVVETVETLSTSPKNAVKWKKA